MSWIWSPTTRRYRNAESGQFLSPASSIELRDDFVVRQRAFADDLARGARMVSNGQLSIQAWEIEMRERVRLVWATEFSFGRGGTKQLTAADKRLLGDLVKGQYDYLHGFAGALADGSLSEAQIQARAQQYFNASVLAYERGRGQAFGGLELPHYPGDGSSVCLSGCRCSWHIEDEGESWRCTWHLSSGNPCATCSSRAATYAPLIIPKVTA